MAPLDPALLDVLACPVCIAAVTPQPSVADVAFLVCGTCGRRYPVRDGIPVMLVDEALDGPASPA
ncbi:MAG: Trm112 family protein [Actinomycetes bacterium]